MQQQHFTQVNLMYIIPNKKEKQRIKIKQKP